MKLFELQAPQELATLEGILDKLFATLGLNVEFSRHFSERLLGREQEVTMREVATSFDQLRKKYKNKLLAAKKKGHYEAILKDFSHDLNIVFGIDGVDLTAVTIMRKDPNKFRANIKGGEELRVGTTK